MRKFAFLLIFMLFSLFALPFTANAATPKQILVVGDSIVGGASNYIGFYMGSDGKAQTTIKSVGGTAICDILSGNGGPWTIDGLLAAKRYDAVVVAYSGNNMTNCMGGRTGQAVVDKYRVDAHALMKVAQQYGSPKVVWVKPPAAATAELNYVRSGVGRVYGYLPDTYSTARVIDGGRGVETADGRWLQYTPCASWDKSGCYAGWVPIGDADGVHFYCGKRGPSYYGVVPPCDTYSAGSNRYGMNLSATRGLIGL